MEPLTLVTINKWLLLFPFLALSIFCCFPNVIPIPTQQQQQQKEISLASNLVVRLNLFQTICIPTLQTNRLPHPPLTFRRCIVYIFEYWIAGPTPLSARPFSFPFLFSVTQNSNNIAHYVK